MATIINLFLASAILLCIFHGGSAQCTLSNITVKQRLTGIALKEKIEIEVEISNNCICSQSSLLLSCKGFDTIEAVDPAIFRQLGGDKCEVNNGLPVFQGSPIKFLYGWDNQVDLRPVSSQINCS